MKRLILLVLIAYAGWYGWNHKGLLQRGPHSEAVVENTSGRPVTRVRLRAGSTVVVREALAPGESVTMPIPTQASTSFGLQWQWGDAPGEPQWSGNIPHEANEAVRYHFQIPSAGDVIFSSAPMPAATSR